MNETITCPHCGNPIDVSEALTGKVHAQLKAEFEKKLALQTSRFQEERQKLDTERKQIELLRNQQDELIKDELEKQLKQERQKIEKALSENLANQMRELSEDNEKKKAEILQFKQKELNILRQETELREKQENLSLELERQMLEKQQEIENNARLKERENFELEKAKLLKQIEDNKKLAEEMKRKAEQASTQMQGEVQEIVLENLLRIAYPFDEISEVPKGVKGADAIQTVINSRQQVCGLIVYESKNTKKFGTEWIAKLKQDQISCKADLAVIVTQTMPAGMDRFGEMDGVWICGFHEVKSLSFVLREILIRTHAVKQTETNKGDKKELLYGYLTSNEFVQNIKQIVENYDGMLNTLNQEKRAMTRLWAQREKQIWQVQESISMLFGSIKGIAGNELESTEILELPGRDED